MCIAIQWGMWESSLVLTGTSWETSWPRGQYIQSTTLESTGVYEDNQWKSWDTNWYEWTSQGASNCMSWNKGFYLALTTAGGLSGTWNSITPQTQTIEIFVKASFVETAGDGTYDNPFGNIVKALSYIEETASTYSGITATICKNWLI